MAIILFGKKMCKSWCQPFNLGAHHYFDFKGYGSWVEFLAASCFVFVFCLFVCLFVLQLPRWVIILFLSLTSGWGFLFFVVFVFVFVLFCVVFSFQSVRFPHHISRVRLIFFFFFVPQVGKVFCFLSFLFVFILFCFVLFFVLFFCFRKSHPPWYQMVRPYPYSITQMMVDITSSTILDSRAIQWKI